MIPYLIPESWIKYDIIQVADSLVEAKASVQSLKATPYQKSWVDELQDYQLKREVAGTSKIEGADFTENELDAAMKETPEELFTRSQKQAQAAVKTYRTIANLPSDVPIDERLVLNIHRNLIIGADDDHCPPGELRGRDHNVNFGIPRHRGVEGGDECTQAFGMLIEAINSTFRGHDTLIQALAGHYHLAAMHPFHDGNGRTARAMEALMLQRSGLKDAYFIAMSNYYYEEKNTYLSTLADVRAKEHDLTEFLNFGLKGIAIQCQRLSAEISKHLKKALYRNMMYDLFQRMQNKRTQVIRERQMKILEELLEGEKTLSVIFSALDRSYDSLSNPSSALVRDINSLIHIQAIKARRIEEGGGYMLAVRLEWPTEITETEFFKRVSEMPKAKTPGYI